MSEAENYNRYLLDLVRRHAPAGQRVLDFGAGGGQFAVPLARARPGRDRLEPDEVLRKRISAAGRGGGRARASWRTATSAASIRSTCWSTSRTTSRRCGGCARSWRPAERCSSTFRRSRCSTRAWTQKSDTCAAIRALTLTAAVRAAGFTIERCAYVDSLGFFATLLFKVVGDSWPATSIARALRLYDRAIFPLSRLVDSVTRRWFGKNLLLIAH